MKKSKKKKFGIVCHYTPKPFERKNGKMSIFSKPFKWKHWYKTKRSREDAERAMDKSDDFLTWYDRRIEYVER